jgi:DNA repair protein RadC
MSYSLRILDLPPTERPREKLIAHGAARLSDAELMAILLATGQGPGKLSAVGLGNLILTEFGRHQRDPLDVLREANPQELMAINGVGPAKAATIMAGIELGKRAFFAKPSELTKIDDPILAARAVGRDLWGQDREHFAILFLDIKHRLLGTKVVTIGTATETLVSPREVFREILKQGATRAIVAHNHPSGNTEPSNADLDLTRQLLAAAEVMGVPILDHLILGNGDRFTSLRQTTQLWERSDRATNSVINHFGLV